MTGRPRWEQNDDRATRPHRPQWSWVNVVNKTGLWSADGDYLDQSRTASWERRIVLGAGHVCNERREGRKHRRANVVPKPAPSTAPAPGRPGFGNVSPSLV